MTGVGRPGSVLRAERFPSSAGRPLRAFVETPLGAAAAAILKGVLRLRVIVFSDDHASLRMTELLKLMLLECGYEAEGVLAGGV
jgi:hypothetical protein